jgi:RecB family endonuclease NucS
MQQLESIEPGLQLEKRQLDTPAGRLDLLCRDANGTRVVLELKRAQGSDQVVGQIARYIGWLKHTYPGEKVRGIVIVGSKDQALVWAAKAVPDLEVKEFKILIQ